MNQTVSVIGAGSWGTALAHLLGSKGVSVRLWAHEPHIVEAIRQTGMNPTYMTGVKLPETITAFFQIEEALADAEVILSVVPTQFMRSVFRKAAPSIRQGACIVSASKGIETTTLMTPTDILEETLGDHARIAALSGPSFAKDVIRGLPAAVTLAMAPGSDFESIQNLFSTPRFRVYSHTDLRGVELGGALKNVMAIAAGISDGLGLGDSTRAALITRGLAEMTRLGVRMGADSRTFSGLAGLGDLVLTCTGDLSRNRTVGLKLGSGMKLAEILAEMKMVAEGVETTKSAEALAGRENVDMPIVSQVHAVLFDGKSPAEAVHELMTRSSKSEFHG